MWIKEIKINNFRNYKGEVSFDLDKKITILYGDNGFGKSSFFDAIEWCLTGVINRFELNDNDNEFDNMDLINEDALKQDNATCFVTLCFGNYILKRHFSTDRGKTKNTYVELKMLSTAENGLVQTIHGKANVESKLRTLFIPNLNDNTLDIKQPFILSQDQVTDFVIKDKPKQRYKALANLVGLNKIINYSDNMRLIIRELNSKAKELNDTVIKTQAVIDSYSFDKKVDIEEIIAIAKDISHALPRQHEEYQVFIDESRFNINSKIINIKKQVQMLEKYSVNETLTFGMMISSKNDLKLTSYRLENHITVVQDFIKRLNNKLSQLEKDEHNRKTTNILLQQQTELSKQIHYKKNDIIELGLNLNVDLDNIDAQVEKVSSMIESCNYHISYYDEFHKVIKENKDFPLEVTEINILLSALTRSKKRKEKWISKISNWILDNSENSGQIKLHELLQGINEYLVLTRENSVCPVCTTNKEGELIDISNSNLLVMTDILQKQTLKVKKVLEIKTKVENALGIIINNIKSAENKEENLNRTIKKNKDQLIRITNDDYFNISIMEKSKQVLLNDVIGLNKEYEILNKSKTYYIQLKELERRNLRLKESIKELTQLIINNSPNVVRLYNKLFKKRVSYLDEVQSMLLKKKMEYDDINLEINILIEHGVTNDEGPFSTKYQQLKNSLGELQSKIELIDKLNSKYSDFKRSKTVEKSIQRAKIEQQVAKDKLKNINSKINLINTYINELNDKVGSEAINFLNQENSSVQQLYRYLNPMVSSKQLKFVADEEELSIKLTSKEENGISKETSAKYVLSSGQMNVLALSIFLSVNEAMDSELDLIAIDDPIQNMDDVNQFSVCDILSNLRRQLIFSTHDLDFIKLFVKKNEHLNDVIQVYMLKQPVITSQESYEQILFGEKLTSEQSSM
ncbi:SMC family ATPase [Peribacillus sp. SIMBA_075]|uniref:AAA family ATPase n=2 Tax=Bacteria TaxID=2 RepID=UPI00397E69CB